MDSNPIELLKNTVYNSSDTETFRVTGTMMQYYAICKRELWFESKRLPIDKSNKNIVRGELIDNRSFSRERNTVFVGGMISPDLLEDGTIVEIKPSSSITTGSKLQLKYYLWFYNEIIGEKRNGVLSIPTENKRIEIKYSDDIKTEVEQSIEDVYEIVTSDNPPQAKEKYVCESCAYYDFCWVGNSGESL